MNSGQVRHALASGNADFEDELKIASASSIPELTAIITRNLADYSRCPVLAMTDRDCLLQHPGHLSDVSTE